MDAHDVPADDEPGIRLEHVPFRLRNRSRFPAKRLPENGFFGRGYEVLGVTRFVPRQHFLGLRNAPSDALPHQLYIFIHVTRYVHQQEQVLFGFPGIVDNHTPKSGQMGVKTGIGLGG